MILGYYSVLLMSDAVTEDRQRSTSRSLQGCLRCPKYLINGSTSGPLTISSMLSWPILLSLPEFMSDDVIDARPPLRMILCPILLPP